MCKATTAKGAHRRVVTVAAHRATINVYFGGGSFNKLAHQHQSGEHKHGSAVRPAALCRPPTRA